MEEGSEPYNSLRASLEELQVDCADDQSPIDAKNFMEIACSLAEEVDTAQKFSYNPSSSEDVSPQLVEVLTRIGYRGSLDDKVSILEFLIAETYASRIASHSRSPAEEMQPRLGLEHDEPPTSVADLHIATFVSQLCDAMDVSADETAHIETCDHLNDVVSLLAGKISDAVVAGAALGARLIPPRTVQSLTEAQLRECQSISRMLEEEYRLRKGMLMTRLDVIVQSFGYSDKAPPGGFCDVSQGLRNAVEASEQPIDTYDALTARDWLLDMESVGHGQGADLIESRVKQVLMGEVPDRGGRVGEAAKAKSQMPKFQPRSTGQDDKRQSGRKKGRSRGRRR